MHLYLHILYKEGLQSHTAFPIMFCTLKNISIYKYVNTPHLNNYIQSCEFSNLLEVFVDLRTCK